MPALGRLSALGAFSAVQVFVARLFPLSALLAPMAFGGVYDAGISLPLHSVSLSCDLTPSRTAVHL